MNVFESGLKRNILRLQSTHMRKRLKYIGEMKLVCVVMMSTDAAMPQRKNANSACKENSRKTQYDSYRDKQRNASIHILQGNNDSTTVHHILKASHSKFREEGFI